MLSYMHVLDDINSVRRLFVVGSYVEAQCWFVTRAPGADESQHASAYARECGGKGLAVALGARRLGAAVDLLVAAGEDAAGDALLALLGREGIDSTHAHRLGPHSGQGCGLIQPQGKTSVTVFAGANALLGERELALADAALRQAAVVYAQLETSLALAQEAFTRASAVGAITVLNASPWPAWQTLDGDEAQALLAVTRVLVLNRDEAAQAFSASGHAGEAPEELADAVLRAFWRAWPSGHWLVITLGAQGCVAYGITGEALRVPGHAVVARQAIGAGDAFSAGLCAALTEGLPMPQALALANACGALAASREGILTTLPARDEAHALVASRPTPVGGSGEMQSK